MTASYLFIQLQASLYICLELECLFLSIQNTEYRT